MEYVIDTHPLVFLIYRPELLGKKAITALQKESNYFFVSAMSVLEVQYLMEVGKIEGDIADIIHYLNQTKGFEISSFSESELRCAISTVSTRDPFDRIILSTAIARDIPIITRDRWMRTTYKKTVW